MAEGLLSPLDVLLRTMRDHAAADRWDDAAKVAALAAPYVHPKLTAAKIEAKAEISLLDLLLEIPKYRAELPDDEAISRH